MKLLDSELVLLDGHCRPEIQLEVESAKLRLSAVAELSGLSPARAAFVADVVRLAETAGRICYRHVAIASCAVCGRKDGYYTYKRWSRYHAAGAPNYDKPKVFSGVDFKYSFVQVRNHASLGCCEDCLAVVKPFLLEKLATVRADVPETFTGHPPAFKYSENRNCTACGWVGHELQMGQLRTLMGDGYYRGKCPECFACNTLMGPTLIRSVEGFQVVPAEINS